MKKIIHFQLTVIKLLPLLLITACGTVSGVFSGASTSSTNGAVMALPSALETAICEGRARDVIDALTQEPLVSASDRFYTALAYEEMGSAVRARQLYAAVMQAPSSSIVRARCADRILANGPVTDEAGRRLAALSQQLAALDVQLAPEAPLHEGLARTSSINATSTIGPAYNFSGGAAQTVTRPASQSPLGQWFAHLSSYGSIESATKNRSTVEKKFPALTGLIDQWELDVNGNTAIRLGIRVSDRSDADRLCGAVKSQGEYCAVIDTSR